MSRTTSGSFNGATHNQDLSGYDDVVELDMVNGYTGERLVFLGEMIDRPFGPDEYRGHVEYVDPSSLGPAGAIHWTEASRGIQAEILGAVFNSDLSQEVKDAIRADIGDPYGHDVTSGLQPLPNGPG